MSQPDYSGKSLRAVTVYGSSTTVPGGAEWSTAARVGSLAASNGFAVITGGYGGSMCAVSEGARAAAAGTEVIGVTAAALFSHRAPNPHLTREVDAQELMERMRHLTSMSRYYVALPGSIGTLQEIISIWTLSIHHRGGQRPVVIAFRDPWERCLRGVADSLRLSDAEYAHIRFVNTPEEAMQVILDDDKENTSHA